MKVKFIKIAMLVVLFSMFFTALAVAAERKDEWKDPNYNFKNLKTILIATTTTVPDSQIDQYDSRKLEAFYNDAFYKDPKKWNKYSLVFITPMQLQEKIMTYTGLDIPQLAIDDPDRVQALIEEYIPICTDAVLYGKVKSLGYTREYVEAYTYTRTRQKETEIETKFQDSNGKWVTGKKIIKEPIEELVTVPAHYNRYANAGMEYTLMDSKTREAVWMLLDIRESQSKKPIDMMKRIIDRSTDHFEKLF